MSFRSYFAKNGILSRLIKDYEYREQQLLMAERVAETLEIGNIAVIEAGTGVGKSLAYLLPSTLYAVENIKRIVISTYSKTLQSQLIEKDLPFLKATAGIDFEYALAMGSNNYMCRRRFDNYIKYDRFSSRQEADIVSHLISWASSADTALKSELSFEVPQNIWDKICREPDMCFSGRCPFVLECGFMKERARLKSSHIIVVNHHLFFANLSAGETILPHYDAVIFDEAHNLEEAARSYFGLRITPFNIKYLADCLYNEKSKKGFLSRLNSLEEDYESELKNLILKLREASEEFFNMVEILFSSKKLPVRLREKEWIIDILNPILRELSGKLKKIKSSLSDPLEEAEAAAYGARAHDLALSLKTMISLSDDNFVYWIDKENARTLSLNASYIDIAPELSKTIFKGSVPVVLTSATLSAGSGLDFFKSRAGVLESSDLELSSPFDYRKNSLIYMPYDLPEPVRGNLDFEAEASERILDLVNISGGGCLALFTSFRHMNSAFEFLSENLTDILVLKQGDMPQYKLLEIFKSYDKSLLLGSNSFWQGVDIPGKALRLLIITKLPFSAPDDPIAEARSERLASQGLNPFMNLSLPEAVTWLKQGFGRLIRSASDKGVAAILDKRLTTRSYGRTFIKALPETLYTSRLDDVRKFLSDNF